MEIQEPLISIGLPAVKHMYLEKTLLSALNQTYSNIEILLVNNASDSAKSQIKTIYEKYKKDSRLHYFENDVQVSMVKNWNKVLKLAKGEFFSLLSDDDIISPDFIKYLFCLSKNYPETNVFYTRLARIDFCEEIKSISPCAPEFEDALDLIYNYMYGFRHIVLSAFLLRRSSILAMGGYYVLPNGISSDTITYCSLACNGGIVCCKEILFYYRESDINTSNSTKLKMWMMSFNREYLMIKNLVISINENDIFSNIKKNMILKVIGSRYLLKKIYFLKGIIIKYSNMNNILSFALACIITVLIFPGPKASLNKMN